MKYSIIINLLIDENYWAIWNIMKKSSQLWMCMYMKAIELLFFNRLMSVVSLHAMDTEGLIVCGNFNCQVHCQQNDKSLKTLEKFWNFFALSNCWISSGKTTINGLTWCDGENSPQSRIDCFFQWKYIPATMYHYFM